MRCFSKACRADGISCNEAEIQLPSAKESCRLMFVDLEPCGVVCAHSSTTSDTLRMQDDLEENLTEGLQAACAGAACFKVCRISSMLKYISSGGFLSMNLLCK